MRTKYQIPSLAALSVMLMICGRGLSQPNPARPDLCQGSYYTEEQAARVGAVVFAYDMVGSGDDKVCDH